VSETVTEAGTFTPEMWTSLADEQPLFRTVRAALGFAYSITEFPIAAICMYGVPSGSTGRMSGMSAHEKHAQGALIRRAVETRLSGVELSLTFAIYGNGAVRGMAIREVVREFAPLVKRAGLGRELVMRYFERVGHQYTQAQLAAQFGLSQQTVSRLERMVGDALDDARQSAERRLEAMFLRTGIAEGL
jgi:hypothetical protein